MIAIERILCPIDLSPDSNEALGYAVAMARAYGAKLTVCHCLEPTRYANEAVRSQTHALIASSVHECQALQTPGPLQLESRVIEGDSTVDIVKEAITRRTDLIVLRSRRRPLAAAIFGSTAEAICRETPCPVLVTHPDGREWKGLSVGEVMIKRVLVAHDFSPNSEAALAHALSLAQEQQAELHILHVMLPLGDDLPYIEDLIQDASQRLRQIIPQEARLWCKVTRVLRAGQPYGEVLDYALEHEMDLICMGKHGSGGGLLTLFGSNTDRVLRQAPCPVLVAPAVSAESASQR
ncbi:MAG: universal stress protein [Acidobacteriota bacterium]